MEENIDNINISEKKRMEIKFARRGRHFRILR